MDNNFVSRPVATGDDREYSLTIEDAVELYARAGLPRTPRTVQRYCKSEHLDCKKAETPSGDKYVVAPYSVTRHIAQIAELNAFEVGATGRERSRRVATTEMALDSRDGSRQTATTETIVSHPVAPIVSENQRDTMRQLTTEPEPVSRPVATERPDISPIVAAFEKQIERLHGDIDFLRGQITTKDQQIGALLERDRETNFLVSGLQKMLSPFLGTGRKASTDDDNAHSFS